MNVTNQIQLHRSILNEPGYDINKNSVILDFGCGDGERVRQYRNAGFNAFGADIKLNKENDFLKLIHTIGGYRIPFPDETFDFVFSESVFEHVQNHYSTLSEIWRILKPGGFSLHFFSPKWKPIEPHLFVPLGGIFQGYSWLMIWPFLAGRIFLQLFLVSHPFNQSVRALLGNYQEISRWGRTRTSPIFIRSDVVAAALGSSNVLKVAGYPFG